MGVYFQHFKAIVVSVRLQVVDGGAGDGSVNQIP